MKRIVKIFLILALISLICAAGFGLYSLYNRPSSGENGPGVNENGLTNHEDQDVVTPHLVDIEEEYYESVNADITLEQLQNSRVVRDVQILNEGSPIAKAIIFIYNAEVIEISGRNLTLTKEGDTLSIYIGENAEIRIATEIDKEAEFRDIRIGDFVNIGAILQIARDDPLWIKYLTILR